jgi:heptosyltransferase-1
MASGKRILIIRLSAIGDVVVTTPVPRAIRNAFPDAYIGWVVEPLAAPFVRGNPYIDAAIVWERAKGALSPRDMIDLRRKLAPHRFEYAIDCQGLLRSALVARISGARTIIGNTNAKEHADLLYTKRIPRRTDDLSSRQRCLDLLRPLGINSEDRTMALPLTSEEHEQAAGALRTAALESGGSYACLVPATTWPQKHWFEPQWAGVADLLRRRLGLTSVLLGGPKDEPMLSRISDHASSPLVNLAGRTSLKSAAAVLSGAAVTVAVDTALMHASVAVGTPTVGVCGASGWPGFKDYPQFELVREEMACSPCYHRPSCGGRFDCMRALTPERVFTAVEKLVGSGAPRELVVV